MDLLVRCQSIQSKLSLGFIEGKLAEHKIVGAKPLRLLMAQGPAWCADILDDPLYSCGFWYSYELCRNPLFTPVTLSSQTPIDGVRPNYAAIASLAPGP